MSSFAAARQLFLLTRASHVQSRVSLQSLLPLSPVSIPGELHNGASLRLTQFSSHRDAAITTRASAGNDAILPKKDDDDGVSLGTMKLPLDIDLERFDILLFQWANSLCQGANLPLPVPLKVDKIRGGARLGFITVEDNGETQVLVYIDCVVSPATDASPTPMFRATRNGAKKDEAAPGEPRIMRSLLAALQKSVEIARV
nr:Porphobilinogen deaminase [Ipomoea batatas]